MNRDQLFQRLMSVRTAALTGAEGILHNVHMGGADSLSEDEEAAVTAFQDTMKLLGGVAGGFTEPEEDEPEDAPVKQSDPDV
jgi:hypothetical protein